jgi:hypothetical protein
MTLRSPRLQREPLLGVQSVDALMIHRPSLPAKKDVELLVAGSNPHAGEVLQPFP